MNKIMLCFFLIISTFAFAQNENIKPQIKISEPAFQGRYISTNDSLELNGLINTAQLYYLSQRMHLTQAQFFTEVDTAYAIADSALKFARKYIIGGDHQDLATSIDHMGLIFHGRQKLDNREWNKFRWYSIPSISKKLGKHRKTVVYWRDFGIKINGAPILLKIIKRPFQ